jgi:hypothetical protein
MARTPSPSPRGRAGLDSTMTDATTAGSRSNRRPRYGRSGEASTTRAVIGTPTVAIM